MTMHDTHAHVLDAMYEAYLEWIESAFHARLAYRRWAGAEEGEAAGAYSRYADALDREERASDTYARWIERARRLVAALDGAQRGVAPAAAPVG
jgi:hypothetical protein